MLTPASSSNLKVTVVWSPGGFSPPGPAQVSAAQHGHSRGRKQGTWAATVPGAGWDRWVGLGEPCALWLLGVLASWPGDGRPGRGLPHSWA